MNLHSRLRAGSAAVLAGVVLLTAACSNATPGAPVAAAASSTSASSTSSSPATTQVTTVTVTASSSTSESSTSTSTTTTESDDTVETDPVTTDSVATDEPTGDVQVDAVTEAWASTTCTQMGLVLAAVLAAPGLDGTQPADYQGEFTAYYATLADTAITATGELSALDPPTFTDGDVFHEGILTYLTELGLAAGNGSIAVAEATDEAAAQAAVQETQDGITALSQADYGLAGFQSGEVLAVLQQVPGCEAFAG